MKRKITPLGEWRQADTWILLIAWCLLLLFVFAECLGITRGEPLLRTLLLSVLCLIFYLGGTLHLKRTGDILLMRCLILLFFLLYLYLLLSFTLLDPALGRGVGSVYDREGEARADYIKRFVNLIPMESISLYIKGFAGGYVSLYYTLLNLAGNLLAFAPFAFFLPFFLPMQQKWYVFFPTLLLSVVAVELLQFAFMIGSCDIDDLILNAGGGMLCYTVLSLPPVKKRILTLKANQQ